MDKHDFGVCGVHCSQCPQGNGRVRFAASELKRLVDTTRYDWLNHAIFLGTLTMPQPMPKDKPYVIIGVYKVL